MTVDLAVATPAFLDITFVGLEAPPALGEEKFAGDVLRSPGGGAITAVGAARLGLTTALASPLGDDAPGSFLRQEVAKDGVDVIDRRARSTPTTVVMPVGSERAMVTVDHGHRCTPAEVAALSPRAVAASLDQLDCLPDGVPAYITCGDDDLRAFARRPPAELSRVKALFLSSREASALAGIDDVEAALRKLAETIETVIVTRGGDGAVAITEGNRLEAPAIEPTGRIVDATGARDLMVAAYVWAALRGADAEARLRWSQVYAGLSLTRPTAVGGAVTEVRLLEEGATRGLALPAA